MQVEQTHPSALVPKGPAGEKALRQVEAEAPARSETTTPAERSSAHDAERPDQPIAPGRTVMGRTFAALNPFGPSVTSNSTFCPSASERRAPD